MANRKSTYNQFHVTPTGERHIESAICHCSPRLNYKDPVNKGEVWVHNLFDQFDFRRFDEAELTIFNFPKRLQCL